MEMPPLLYFLWAGGFVFLQIKYFGEMREILLTPIVSLLRIKFRRLDVQGFASLLAVVWFIGGLFIVTDGFKECTNVEVGDTYDDGREDEYRYEGS